MTYELWDRASGNRLGTWKRPEPAYELVREIVEDDGPEAAEALILGTEDDEGHPTGRVAEGRQLIELARAGVSI